ncbi:MAG: ABC transporter permease [Ignavibacteriae bacterium]|nr:ABC transporter permease [Ignavibacteriota bacterium]
MMRVERLIALRYLRSKQQTQFINIIMLVSVVGITVGVAALIVVLSVFNGFNKVVTDVLVGFDPHIRVLPATGKSFGRVDSILKVMALVPRVQAASPYVEHKALVVSKGGNRVVVIKGVIDSTAGEVSGVVKATALGKFSLRTERGVPGIVVGLALADRLGIVVGSEVTVVSPVGVDAMIVQYSQPDMRKFVVTGIFDSRNKEYDSHFAFVSLDVAARLFRYAKNVSGIEVRLQNIEESEQVQARLQALLGDELSVMTWYDLHKDLYSVMKIERWGAYIILCLIIGVASFNMLGSLAMGVMEKRRDIGVLKALGLNARRIVKLFMFEGILVGVLGTLLGIGIGLFVCYLQMEYHLFPLDPSVYIIDAIPVDIRWSDFVAVGFASMLLSSLAAFYPARQAGKLLPVDAIRWE